MLPPKIWCLLLAFCVAVHAGLALGYARALPPLHWPDEPAHLNYSLALARGEGFAVMGPAVWQEDRLRALVASRFSEVDNPLDDESLSGMRYQAHQPPLFYLLAAGALRLAPALLTLRLLNLVLSCASLVIAALFVRRALQRDDVALLAAGFLAVWPTRAFLAVSIGNDPAIELVFSCFFLALVAAKPRVLLTGALFGLGLLTKSSALLLPLVQLVWGLPDRVRALRTVALATGIGILLASAWMLRNALLYGWLDPLAMQAGAWGLAAERPSLQWVGEYGVVPFLSTLFASFWGVFGWMEMMPSRGQLVLYGTLTFLAALGWGRQLAHPAGWLAAGGARGADRLRATIARCAAVAALLLATVILYSLADYQPQGRYLLPGAAPIALLFSLGWISISRRHGQRLAAAALGALLLSNVYSLLHVIPWYLAAAPP